MRKSNKVQKLKCHYCDNHATHAILIDLREKPGPPVKKNNVLSVVCDIHSVETSFDSWVPVWAFKKLADDWRTKANVILDKRYCTITALKLEND